MTWYPGKNVARTKNLDFSRTFCGASVFMDLQRFSLWSKNQVGFGKGVVVPKNKKRDLRPRVFKVFEGLLWHDSDKSVSNILLLLDSSRKWFILYEETLLDSELFRHCWDALCCFTLSGVVPWSPWRMASSSGAVSIATKKCLDAWGIATWENTSAIKGGTGRATDSP